MIGVRKIDTHTEKTISVLNQDLSKPITVKDLSHIINRSKSTAKQVINKLRYAKKVKIVSFKTHAGQPTPAYQLQKSPLKEIEVLTDYDNKYYVSLSTFSSNPYWVHFIKDYLEKKNIQGKYCFNGYSYFIGYDKKILECLFQKYITIYKKNREEEIFMLNNLFNKKVKTEEVKLENTKGIMVMDKEDILKEMYSTENYRYMKSVAVEYGYDSLYDLLKESNYLNNLAEEERKKLMELRSKVLGNRYKYSSTSLTLPVENVKKEISKMTKEEEEALDAELFDDIRM